MEKGKTAVANGSSSIDSAITAVNLIVESSKEAAAMIQETAHVIEESSSSIEEITVSINEISDLSEESAKNLGKTVELANIQRESINQLLNSSQDLLDVVSTLENETQKFNVGKY